MTSLNQCNFIGRLGKRAEVRTMQSGKRVASFSLAVDQSYKKDGQKVEKTEWVKVVVFQEGLIKILESYTSQGSLIYVSGSLQTRKYVDKSGVERYMTEVVLQGFDCKIQLLDSKKESGEQEVKQEVKEEKELVEREIDDPDIPF